MAQLSQGDTLVLSVDVSGVPTGRTIAAAKVAVGSIHESTHSSITDNTVVFMVAAADTALWPAGLHTLQIKVRLDDNQVSEVVRTTLEILTSDILSTV